MSVDIRNIKLPYIFVPICESCRIAMRQKRKLGYVAEAQKQHWSAFG